MYCMYACLYMYVYEIYKYMNEIQSACLSVLICLPYCLFITTHTCTRAHAHTYTRLHHTRNTEIYSIQPFTNLYLHCATELFFTNIGKRLQATADQKYTRTTSVVNRPRHGKHLHLTWRDDLWDNIFWLHSYKRWCVLRRGSAVGGSRQRNSYRC